MRFRKCVGTLILMSLLAACGSRSPGGFHPSGRAAPVGDSSASPSDAGEGSAAGAPSSDGAQPQAKTPEAAIAAYRNYQLAYERAYEDNDVSVLGPVAMDPLLTKIGQDVASVRGQGLVWRFHNVLNPKVQGTSRDGSTVVVLDCVRTLGAFKYSATTGKRLGSWRGGTFQYQAVMRYDDDTWKISDATRGGTC